MMIRKSTDRNKRNKKREPLAVKRACSFCQKGCMPDWKNAEDLRRFVSERGRILPASRTGLCAKDQRKVSVAIKRARHLGLLPFVLKVK